MCFSRWGRWKDILTHGRFKKQLTEWDVESICRALLSYCLVHYRGDDKIKGFMWDLIAPTEDGRTKELQNHLGGSHLLHLSVRPGAAGQGPVEGPVWKTFQEACLTECAV